jgi:hypothetical protein
MFLLRQGVIQSGEYAGWRIQIDDDRAESGGYYLYYINMADKAKGYDEWFKEIQQLYNQLAEYKILWDGDEICRA